MPSPLKKPESVDIVVFRENSEDIYSGIEFKAGDALCEKLISDLKTVYSVSNIHYPKQSGLGDKGDIRASIKSIGEGPFSLQLIKIERKWRWYIRVIS